ncbi:Uncharacterised protein [uncultured archaeon]|nr:Uncharacterised protein [uncultured archaeon]
MERNNTSFPSEITKVLKKVYETYKSKTDQWSNILRYYQYVIRFLMDNELLDSLLIAHQMGTGKTLLASAVAITCLDRYEVIFFSAKTLHHNFIQTVKDTCQIIGVEDVSSKMSFVAMDAPNMLTQLNKQVMSLDNKMIIFDEAHNFFRSIINGDEKSNAKKLYNLIMLAKNTKKLFLTGSIVSKTVFEIVACFNMLSNKELLPENYFQFRELYIDEESGKIKTGVRDKLANRLVGYVSYIAIDLPREPNQVVSSIIREEGGYPQLFATQEKRVEMSSEQYKFYWIIREREIASLKRFTGKERTIQAMSIPKSDSKMMRTFFVRSRMVSNFLLSDKKFEKIDIKLDDFNEINSPKMTEIVKEVNSTEGKVLIYSQFVDYGGLKSISKYLERAGYVESKLDDVVDDAKRYVFISGKIPMKQRPLINKLFNSKDNINGNKIKVILISKTGAEGINTTCVRKVILTEPYWTKTRDEQVISRAVRQGSHDMLPKEKRDVNVSIYLATKNSEFKTDHPIEEITIDEEFQKKSLFNYKSILDIREVLKEVSIECSVLNYGSCRLCIPTNQQLYDDDFINDVNDENKCVIGTIKKKELKEVSLEGKTYLYEKDVNEVLGYKFYEFDSALDKYVSMNSSDDRLDKLIELI